MYDLNIEVVKRWLAIDSLAYYDDAIKLSSGKKSNVFIDCMKVLGDSFYYKHILKLFEANVEKRPDYYVGKATGAIPIASGLSSSFGWFYVKKDLTFCGPKLNYRYFPYKTSVVIVDDVITSGQSVIDCINVCKDNNLEPIQVLAIVDRENGGIENIKKHLKSNINVSAFFKLSEIEEEFEKIKKYQ